MAHPVYSHNTINSTNVERGVHLI